VIPIHLSRRAFSGRIALLGMAGAVCGLCEFSRAQPAIEQQLSHSADHIHQEVTFNASPKRLYDALTSAEQFTKVTTFSSVKNAPPAEISKELGGSFALFGGHIVGRHLEFVPNKRLVQAWRVVTWAEGIYSIAEFQLMQQGNGTKLVFDHSGFPNGLAQHLADGWKANYWEPLRKYLAG
jgi:activator of HSP90 ATPase